MGALAAQVSSRKLRATDRFATLLVASLAGYALMGKGYAYAGVSPLFITEGVLVLGLLAMLHSRCLVASFASLPMLLLACLMGLTVMRTVPFLGAHGVDALRDSVLVLYGLFAFVTVALLLERPERVASALRFLQWFTGVFVFVAPAVFLLSIMDLLASLPGWPGSGVPFLSIRSGEVAVHLSACAVMALLGLRKVTLAWTIALLLGIALIASLSRGGMLAIVGPVMFAIVAASRWRLAGTLALYGGLALAVLYLLDVSVPLQLANQRDASVRQIVDNLISITGSADRGDLDDNKRWRLLWWEKIQDYTFSGPYYWTGKGFGINLAEADGYLGAQIDGPPLRSPHNSHMNILARIGVPGLALWITVGLAWLAATTRCMRAAWRNGDEAWGNLMLLTICYWLAIVIDAAFDVAIEAPMLGVWFWCLFGFGIGNAMIYGTHTKRLALASQARVLALR